MVHVCPHCGGRGRIGSPEVSALLPRVCLTCNGTGSIPTVLTLEPGFHNQNGSIRNLLHEHIGSAVMIESLSGAVRAQHWHRTDWHFCYVVSGAVVYKEAPLLDRAVERPPQTQAHRDNNDNIYQTVDIQLPSLRPDRNRITTHELPAGALFYTPPMLAHAMYFPKHTLLLVLANRARTKEDHEADLVRLTEGERL